MLYEIIQDNKTVWFCGNDHNQMLMVIQYMFDSSAPSADWTTFYVYKIDGANVTAIPLAAYFESYKLECAFLGRWNNDR